ncbi:hypothetical protein [Klebsiella pneumoniae]|uniref:hypothetical protein n=1 Tax=Klebsiella pneumoniae TaxID=573 RepID=UPI0021D30A43|nr:hypothetical protein [Klebsiella pneumoniae]MCU6593593.1 hypothetical protein [Klebsiella pneumoniae]
MSVTVRKAIIQNVRQFRTVPAGSFLWLDIPGADDFIESREVRNLDALLEKYGKSEELVVHLDTPEGDFEDSFRINVCDLINPPALPCKTNGAIEAREIVVTSFGAKKIENVEALVTFYAGYLLEKFRASHGYTGPDPIVKTRWHTKSSWGGRKGITISPGYLYNTSSDFFGFAFREYRHVSKSPLIGDFISLNRLNHVKALVAHELAHFLQRNTEYASVPALDYRRSHGEGWQYLYTVTRADLNRFVSN